MIVSPTFSPPASAGLPANTSATTAPCGVSHPSTSVCTGVTLFRPTPSQPSAFGKSYRKPPSSTPRRRLRPARRTVSWIFVPGAASLTDLTKSAAFFILTPLVGGAPEGQRLHAIEPKRGEIEPIKGEERTLAHKYAWDRSQTGIRRATIWHELNILRTGISWAAKPGRRLIDPVNVWLPRRAGSRNTHMSAEQLVKVAGEYRAPHLKLFVILAICTGARKAAILQLKWDRVNMKAREIDFRLDRDQDDILDSGGMKGRSIVPIGRRLYRELEVARNWRTTDYVIEHNGKPVLDVKTALNAAMKRAGIEGKFYGAHAIRHSVATIIADRGGELRQIQKLLGHEDFGTTDKIYASHTSGYLSSAVDIVDGFLGGSEPGQKTPDDGILDEDTEHTGI